jgi:anti-anti-sigma factor
VATSALLIVEIERQPGCTVLTIRGELDMSNAPVLTQHVDHLLEMGGARVVLDVDGMTFCDSVGLRALVLAANRAVDRGGWLRLAAPQQEFTHLLSVVNLLSALPTYRSVPAAVDGDPAERILA